MLVTMTLAAVWLLACLGLACMGLGCGAHEAGEVGEAGDAGEAGQASGQRERLNVLLITIDTLRADYLGFGGHAAATSPALDRFAAGAVVFENARATSSWTLASLGALMTSTLSRENGCRDFGSRLADDVPTLAELLRAAGWRTGGVASHVFLGEKHGLNRGFDEYDQELVQEITRSHAAITSPRVTQKGLAWIAEHEGGAEPWFLWLHYFDPHADYLEHGELSRQFGTETSEQLYEGEIAFTDRAIGRLLDRLARTGALEDTLVVVTADHGEEWEEHGRLGHGNTLHAEVLDVPLVVRVPGVAPRRIAEPVSLLDVLPTVLELVGVEAPRGVRGRSLAGALERGVAEARPVVAELWLRPGQYARSVETDGWKLIVDRGGARSRLYEQGRDPGELRDLQAGMPERAAVLESLLEDLLPARDTEAAGPVVEHTAQELETLRALGYLGDQE